MNPTLRFDFTRSLTPVLGKAAFGEHGKLPAPDADLDPRRGLAFPLKSGGCALASDGIINDAAGALEIVFVPTVDNATGALVQAWGQYAPLIELTGEGVKADLYGCSVDVMARIEKNHACTVRLVWDCRAGFTLSIKPQARPQQELRRRLTWTAYRQSFVPFAIGGVATGPQLAKWQGGFAGWIKSLTLWSAPVEPPGPVSVSESGEPLPRLFPPAPGVKLLSLDDPPIRPDPLRLVQLPDRQADLEKTRRVCKLDDITSHCRSEIEVFAAITSYVARLWPHCHYWPWPDGEQRWIFWKRGHEIVPSIREGDAGGMCGGYAHVMEELFWAMGFDARRIQVSGHSSFEAYSNAQDRWMICDASWNDQCHFLADATGRFLGAGDLIRRHEALEHDPRALWDVRALTCRGENLVPITSGPGNPSYPSPYVAAYDHVGLSIDKTNEYGRDAPTWRGKTRFAWYYRECERAWHRKDSPMGLDNFMVDNLDDLYPSRNRAAVTLTWEKKGESLRVRAKPVGVTFFDAMLATADDGPEQRFRDRFVWRLHPGVNCLSVRTLNRLGARGYPFRVVLWAAKQGQSPVSSRK